MEEEDLLLAKWISVCSSRDFSVYACKSFTLDIHMHETKVSMSGGCRN